MAQEAKQGDVPESDVLILGCGLVAGPLVKYLNSLKYKLIIATRTISKGEKCSKLCDFPDLIYVTQLDVESRNTNLQAFEDTLSLLVSKSKIVVSLLPYVYHPVAAEFAIKFKKHFCTTSYISAAMEKFDEPSKANDLLFLNECGVDPGLDHMEAARVIDDINSNDGTVLEFRSICGGLPAPQDNTNPLGYKFSWAPKGVLLATNNNVKQLIFDEILAFEGKHLFDNEYVFTDNFNSNNIGTLQWYFNRDSTIYQNVYNLPNIQTLIRGTYRYPGWCETLRIISLLGLTKSDNSISTQSKTFNEYFCEYLKVPSGVSIYDFVAQKFNITADHVAIRNLQFVGISDSVTQIPSEVNNTPIDILCHLLLNKLFYKENEKDMIVMKHSFEIYYPKDGWRETRESVMMNFGLQGRNNNNDNNNNDSKQEDVASTNVEIDISLSKTGDSSMARTVSLPLAVAIEALLKGELNVRGLQRPVVPELYNLILPKVSKMGIEFDDRVLGQMIWFRDEIKPGERRVGIVPADIPKLMEAGFRIVVERSQTRIFKDEEYEALGCQMVDSRSWQTDAPTSALIFGLKELPEPEPLKLRHRHIFFAHCYKNQQGSSQLFKRFKSGQGEIYDLEFIVNPETKRRIAAFGYAAGMCGMGVGIIKYVLQKLDKTNELNTINNACNVWESQELMFEDCKSSLLKLQENGIELPKIIIIGALGRCGRGAVFTAEQCGIPSENIMKWHLHETSAKPGPYTEIINDNNIFINCIRLLEKIPPFLNNELINKSGNNRKLSMIVDVACDPDNPNNPIPVYNKITTMFEPIKRVIEGNDGVLPLDVIAIDHLPSLVPREASIGFSKDLIDTLITLKDRDNIVWNNVRQVYYQKMEECLGANGDEVENKENN